MRWRRRKAAFTLGELMVMCAMATVAASVLFFPALLAARERARRTACAGNLDEIGKGVEMYLGLFSDYYPGHLEWGAQPPGEKTKLYLQSMRYEYKTPEGKTRVGRIRPFVNHKTYPAYMHWVLGTGYVGPYDAKLPGPNEPKVAPLNLGHLLSMRILRDEKVFYCPSGLDVRHQAGEAYKINDTLADWAETRRDGPQADLLCRGSWPREVNSPPTQDNIRYYAVGSQYAYRNAPIFCRYELADKPGYSLTEPVAIAYTKPRVFSAVGCPPFKTARLLGARALVCDDFYKAKPDDRFIEKADTMTPGWGINFHKDGYNVLYGNQLVKWHGDPEQGIIYWDTAQLEDESGGALGNTWHWVGSATGGAPRNNAIFGTPLVWHIFDVASGIYVDVEHGM